jgi:anti-sigma regulatory factor (Ser/Thr protein kinase)
MSASPVPEDVVRVRIPGGPQAAGTARKTLARLRADLDTPLRENLRLLVTELVTNSVRHTGADFVDLMVLVGNQRLRVEVTDSGSGFNHRPRDRSPYDEGGWGLVLVDRLSEQWGVSTEAGYARVWFELARA